MDKKLIEFKEELQLKKVSKGLIDLNSKDKFIKEMDILHPIMLKHGLSELYNKALAVGCNIIDCKIAVDIED